MKNQKGFTLIELLLVLAIIGIIAAIAIPALLGQREKAKAKAVQSMVANIAGECARVGDDLRQKNGTQPTPAEVITAVRALTNYSASNAKNPYSPGTGAIQTGGTTTGTVALTGNPAYADAATGNTYPAVEIHGFYLSGGAKKSLVKIVAID
jgi:prepilin-type N-terminal cleavage/methylation domain-containing protein